MVYAQSEPVLKKETLRILWDFEIQMDHLISARQSDLVLVHKTKRTCPIVEFYVPTDHWVKLKKSEKQRDYQGFAIEVKKLWNIKLTVKPMVIGALGTATEGLVQGLGILEIRGRVETIQITAL